MRHAYKISVLKVAFQKYSGVGTYSDVERFSQLACFAGQCFRGDTTPTITKLCPGPLYFFCSSLAHYAHFSTLQFPILAIGNHLTPFILLVDMINSVFLYAFVKYNRFNSCSLSYGQHVSHH